MKVRELMTHPAITCPIDATVNRAAQLMWDHDCGAIPIVDAEGRLAGIITDRDICMAAYTQGQPLQAIPITAVMTRPALACHLDDAVEAAEHLMHDGQVRRVPVIDNERRPVGLVSLNDIARNAARADRSDVHREVVEVLAAVCEPRPHVGHGDGAVGEALPVAPGGDRLVVL